MLYKAAAAYPYVDRERATAALRGQLRLIALAGGGRPDWSTLVVEGPIEAPGLRGRTWFEWTASVNADGGRDLTKDPVDDDVPSVPADGSADITMPQAAPGILT